MLSHHSCAHFSILELIIWQICFLSHRTMRFAVRNERKEISRKWPITRINLLVVTFVMQQADGPSHTDVSEVILTQRVKILHPLCGRKSVKCQILLNFPSVSQRSCDKIWQNCNSWAKVDKVFCNFLLLLSNWKSYLPTFI